MRSPHIVQSSRRKGGQSIQICLMPSVEIDNNEKTPVFLGYSSAGPAVECVLYGERVVRHRWRDNRNCKGM